MRRKACTLRALKARRDELANQIAHAAYVDPVDKRGFAGWMSEQIMAWAQCCRALGERKGGAL